MVVMKRLFLALRIAALLAGCAYLSYIHWTKEENNSQVEKQVAPKATLK